MYYYRLSKYLKYRLYTIDESEELYINYIQYNIQKLQIHNYKFIEHIKQKKECKTK